MESNLSKQIAERVALLLRAREAYYNGNEPLMSDASFDRLEEQLRKWQPKHPYFDRVGAASNAANENAPKIRHKVAMLSMDKARQMEGIRSWFQRLQDRMPHLKWDAPLCVQPKIDGISASCCYRNGSLQYVATRGDGEQGQNIRHIAPFVADIPPKFDPAVFEKLDPTVDFEVRGELYLPSNTIEDTGRPLRNICAGLLHRKEQSPEEMRDLRFIAYQCPQQRLADSEYRQIQLLAQQGFHTVPAKLCAIDELESYFQQYLNELRATWPYETDGLIICLDDSRLFAAVDSLWQVSHHHHYAIALKPPAESGYTLLCEVRWQVGRQGRLSPVAEFLPLTLASAVIERASLHNYANVQRLNIQRGDVLEIERAGDVIPYVRRNLGSWDSLGQSELAPLSLEETGRLARQIAQQHGRAVIPECCPSCGGTLNAEGVHLLCPRRDCPEQVIQRILFWVQQAGMEQVAEQSIRQLYRQGKLHSLHDLYKLEEKDLRQMPGYADKKIARFLSERENSRRLSIHQLVERLGIPMVQQRSLQKLGELRRKSRWEIFIRLVAEEWQKQRLAIMDPAATSEESERRLLQEAMLAVFPQVLYDWSGSCDAALAGHLLDALPQADLLRLWGSKTGREKLWKNGTVTWQKILLGQEPAYLELRQIEDFTNFREPPSRYSVLENLRQWLAENRVLLQELLPVLHLQNAQSNAGQQTRQNICMTGNGPLPRKQLQEKLEALGYRISSSLNKNTNILLCADPAADSSKLKKAQAWGIRIYPYDTFLAQLGEAAVNSGI